MILLVLLCIMLSKSILVLGIRCNILSTTMLKVIKYQYRIEPHFSTACLFYYGYLKSINKKPENH